MKMFRYLILLSLVFFISNGHAAAVRGLFEGEVPILDKSTTAQNNGIRAALLQVMIKLTGKRSAAGIYGVDEILKQPKQFLQQYQVRTIESENESPDTYRLWAKFDAHALQTAIREYNIPIWSQERPNSLIWLVQNSPEGADFLPMREGNFYYDVLTTQAMTRGIELLAPHLDTTDRSNLTVDDIKTQAISTIQSASARYPSNTTLTATINKLGTDLWQVDWLAIINQQASRWQTNGSSASQALSEGIDLHADKLASQYVQQVGFASESNFNIKVNGISNFDDYANVLKYLESLNFINQVIIKEVNDASITYNLLARGDVLTLEQAVSLGYTLKPVGDGQTFQYIQ